MASTWREFLKWKIYKKNIFPYRPSIFCLFFVFFQTDGHKFINENIFRIFKMLLCKKKWAGIGLYIRVDIFNGTQRPLDIFVVSSFSWKNVQQQLVLFAHGGTDRL
jgi:hypothetical protein